MLTTPTFHGRGWCATQVHTWHSVEKQRLGRHVDICDLANNDALRVPARSSVTAGEALSVTAGKGTEASRALPIRLIIQTSVAENSMYQLVASRGECHVAVERDVHVDAGKRGAELGQRRRLLTRVCDWLPRDATASGSRDRSPASS